MDTATGNLQLCSIKYEWKPCLSSVNPMMMPEDLENITEVRIRKASVQHPSAIQS
jgi:hypothetical protein